MFDKIKAIKEIGELKTKVVEANKKIEDFKTNGKSNCGSVLVEMSGKGDILKITNSDKNKDGVEDKIIEAINQARKRTDLFKSKVIKEATGGLDVGALF